MKFCCPKCNKMYNVKDEMAGKRAKCSCGHSLVIPKPRKTTELPSCPECRLPLRKGETFCRSCGFGMQTGEKKVPEHRETEGSELDYAQANQGQVQSGALSQEEGTVQEANPIVANPWIGVMSAMFFLSVGVFAIMYPDLFGDYVPYGRRVLFKWLVMLIWGRILGVICVIIGIFVCFFVGVIVFFSPGSSSNAY